MSDFAGGVICGAVLMLLLAMVGSRAGGGRPTGDPTTPPPPPESFVKHDRTTVSYEPRPLGSRPPRASDKPTAARTRPSDRLIVHRNPDGSRQPIRGLE